jgi:hypothetical protein
MFPVVWLVVAVALITFALAYIMRAIVDKIRWRRGLRALRKASQHKIADTPEYCKARWLDKYGGYAEGIDFEGSAASSWNKPFAGGSKLWRNNSTR